MLVNFVGLRHLTEALIPRISDRGSITSITSVAGMGWSKNLDAVRAMMETSGFSEQFGLMDPVHPRESPRR